MKTKQTARSKSLFQGMGIGYVICLLTHIIAALIPMYVVFPFAQRFFSHGHEHHYSHGLLSHVLGDILILTMIIVPVAALTFLGHKLVRRLRCGCGEEHENDPCESCEHRKY